MRVIKEGKNTNGVLDKVYIAYGSSEYSPSKFKPVNLTHWRSAVNNKPFGGLWASPIDSKWGWKDWCQAEEWNTESLNTHFTFTLAPGTNIYVIDNEKDLVSVSTFRSEYMPTLSINFAGLINNGYDGIYVTDNAARNFRYSTIYGISDLNSWDCESICIFNKDVIVPNVQKEKNMKTESKIIKLTETEFKNFIKESVTQVIENLNEAANAAFDRSKASAGMEKIWQVIDRKQKHLYDIVFGDLSDKLDELTLEKVKLMGAEHLDVPSVICRAGNDKLPEGVLIVNMSSSLMCPSFYLGLCQIKKGACYAQRAENQHSNNVLPQRFKTDLMHTQMLRQYQNGNKTPMKEYFRIIELYIQLANKYATDECNKVIKQLEAKRRQPLTKEQKEIIMYEHSKNRITDVRLNETGDFHCQIAVDLWAKFAKKIKQKYGINTHAYTARNLDFTNASQHISMNYSHGGEYDSEYQKPRYFQVVKDEVFEKLTNVPLDENGQPVLGPLYNKKKYYKCPCSDTESKCDLCGVCFRKNETGQEYTIVVKLHGQKNATGLKNGFTIKEVKPVVDTYHKIGWTSDSEHGKENVQSLQDFSKNVERLRASDEKSKKKTKSKTPKTKKV
jgi:hypothetical protein